MGIRALARTLAGVAVGVAASIAFAGPVTVSDPLLTVTATNADGDSGSFSVNVNDPGVFFFPDPGIYIFNTANRDIVDPDNNVVVGRIDQLGTTIVLDPVIGITFAVTSGASPTTFTISSALVSFAGITNPEVSATSSLGVTDRNNNGASLVGGYAGSLAYLTQYNGGTTFDTQTGPIVAGPGNSAGGGENPPPVIVPGVISSMNSQLSFTVSSLDSGNGTVNYSVKPEPASALLLAVGVIAMARRRQ